MLFFTRTNQPKWDHRSKLNIEIRRFIFKQFMNVKGSIKKLFSLNSKYWAGNNRVKSSHPNANRLNHLISKKIQLADSRLIDLSDSGEPFTAKEILEMPKPQKESSISVCEAIMQKAIEVKNALKAYRKLNNLKNHFENFGDMAIDEFDFAGMKAFEKYLNDQPRINSLETSARYLKDLKRCLAAQMYNDKKVLGYRLTFGSNPKPKLTANEIEKFAAFNNPRYNLSRDIFLACFYTWGSRISSVLTLEPRHLIDGRLIFLEYKGKKKTKSVKINEQLQSIIDKYAGKSAFYLFPVMTASPLAIGCTENEKYRYDKHIESKTNTINKDLKVIAASCGITKNVSTHVARHSFAYISHKKWG